MNYVPHNIQEQLDQALAQIGQFEFSRSFYVKNRPEACSVAHSPANVDKNRYNRWGFPFDHNLISSIPDYINASPMQFNGQRYIAAQGPRKNTLKEFWQMAWSEEASLIVSVTNEKEFGTGWTEYKFERFWPVQGEEQFGCFTVQSLSSTLVQEWQDGREEKIRQRRLLLKKGAEEREIIHLHMENWPDSGVIHPSSLFALAEHAKPWEQGSIIVHCAAGVGRTGTFIAFHSLYRELLAQLKERVPTLDVVGRIKHMRQLRWGAIVAAPEQYRLLIDALRHATGS